MEIGRAECFDEVERILSEEMGDYRGGLIASGAEHGYRGERISEICGQVAWILVQQVRKGHIREMAFEVPFGRGEKLPPIEIDAGSRKILIRGKIDRLDILDGSEAAVRVVDYKTGDNKIDLEYFRKGYKLQLMIYLKAGLSAGETAKPAGVFYFKIHDIKDRMDEKKVESGAEAAEDRMRKSYTMEGIMVDDKELIESMDRDIGERSDVIPVKFNNKEGVFAPTGGGELLSSEEFATLCSEVDIQLERICREIAGGEIAVRPKKEKEKGKDGSRITACTYCGYRSICLFDPSANGCEYENI